MLAALLGLGASEWSSWSDETVVTFAAGGTALYSAVLWWAHRQLLQHAAVFAELLVGVGTGVSLLLDAGALLGLAIWGVSAAWLALAWVGSCQTVRSERYWARSGWSRARPRWWMRAGV